MLGCPNKAENYKMKIIYFIQGLICTNLASFVLRQQTFLKNVPYSATNELLDMYKEKEL